MRRKTVSEISFALILYLSIIGGVQYARAVWSNAPNNLISTKGEEPVIASRQNNVKTGALVVNVGGAENSSGLVVANGKVIVGDPSVVGSNIVFAAEQALYAERYCDNSGLNCVTPDQFSGVSPTSIPIGAIAPFVAACPSPTWVEYTPLKGRYPYGNNLSLGQPGGGLLHNHYKVPYVDKPLTSGPDELRHIYTNNQTPVVPLSDVLYCKKEQ